MPRQLVKGNDAIVKGAILAGCRAFFGYPITPANEISEAAAYYFPLVGGTFIQAESEVSAINMVFGAASAGVRAMTASSGPGISLMQEGISYLAGAELPCVIVDITRGGPGLGNIGPEQGDYHQVVKGGGHGCYRTPVLAPASAQEMADLTKTAFVLADEFRNPVIVMADGCLGQMMEPVEFSPAVSAPRTPFWSVDGTAVTRNNLISSIQLEPDELERHIRALEAKYRRLEQEAVRYETWLADDAELILVGYGIVARILKSVVERLRAHGVAAGLLRPITLWPFPNAEVRRLARSARAFLAVEMSNGQMVDDVRLALSGAFPAAPPAGQSFFSGTSIMGPPVPYPPPPVYFYGRAGGNIPSVEEIVDFVLSSLARTGAEEVHAHAD